MGSTTDTQFRPDIQGLRGVAVLLVMIYHTKLALPGGYLGVDVFFVISGFVITQMLLRELESNNTINLKAFFSRRIKRILPALCVVTCFTLFLSLIILSPFGDQQKAISASRATTMFFANFHFLLVDTYTELTTNPFRQMWSLSIEEQFYLMFPFFLLLIYKLSKNLNKYFLTVIWGIVVLTAISVRYFKRARQENLLSLPFQRNLPISEFEFYLPTHRIWQFLLGVVAAYFVAEKYCIRRPKNKHLGTLGLAIILFSSVFFTDNDPYHSFNNLLPCIGATFIIVGGTGLATNLLTSAPIRWFGEISYSLYLWHWPLFVFLLILFPDAGLITFSVVFIVSVLFAFGSFRFIESPFRSGTSSIAKSARSVLALAILLPLFTSVLQQVSIPYQKSLYDTYNYTNNREELASQKLRCADTWLTARLIERCTILAPQSKGSVLLIGDSQAESFSDGVAEASKQLQLNATLFTFASCPAIDLKNSYRAVACPSNKRTMELIYESRPNYLVVSNALVPYLADDNCPMRENLECANSRTDRINDWFEAFSSLANYLESIEQKTIFIMQTPYFEYDSRGLSLIDKVIGVSSEQSDRDTMVEQGIFESRMKTISSNSKYLKIIYPGRTICSNISCKPETKEQRGWFRDAGHLSKAGSLQLTPEIKLAIQHFSS
jgi:peptidoglycan/LPS O-acetylase OafA/YrhL